MDLSRVFKPSSVAVIGASEKPGKVGQTIMQNYLDVGFQGDLFPVNINAGETILGKKAYKSVLDIKKNIDLAVIAIPAELVPKALEECGKAKAKGVVVVSGGFSEVGNTKLQDQLVAVAKKYKMPVIGPNCLGVMDTRARNDTLFLPTFKIDKPKIGGVSFVSQSGSVGSSILDLISGEGFGLAKFISYGNAAVVDEVDILNCLANDKDTRVIVYYLEGVRRGREFIEVAKKVTKQKPVVIIKGGRTQQGVGAAHSHTASLAGSYAAYEAVFRQSGFVMAKTLEELLYFSKIFETQPLCKGNRVAIITNGGGHGVIATDALSDNGLVLPQLSKETLKNLRKQLPPIVNVEMPLDLGGEADDKRYELALEALNNDPNVDAILAIVLFQTPGADDKVASTVVRYGSARTKPLVAVSTGGKYTQAHVENMESLGVPVYETPNDAAASLAALIDYTKYKGRVEK